MRLGQEQVGGRAGEQPPWVVGGMGQGGFEPLLFLLSQLRARAPSLPASVSLHGTWGRNFILLALELSLDSQDGKGGPYQDPEGC
jgi:hypothetical protein